MIINKRLPTVDSILGIRFVLKSIIEAGIANNKNMKNRIKTINLMLNQFYIMSMTISYYSMID